MIVCSGCGKKFDDDTPLVTCDQCGTQLRQPVRPALPSPQPRGKDEAASSAIVRMPNSSHKSKEATEPEARTLEEDEDHLDAHHLAAITEYGKAKSIVTVIGFPGSGKTFLVNRLRDELPKLGWKSSKPPVKGDILLDPDWLALTTFVPPSTVQKKGQNRSYVVVDCAGESLAQALEQQFATDTLEGTLARSYMTAIACASAYVLVVRADEVLGVSRGEEGRDASRRKALERVEEMGDRFNDIISAIVVSKGRLKNQKPEDFVRQGVSPDELAGALDRIDEHFSQPLCVVFSQADLLDPKEEGDEYDADPFLFAIEHGKKLFRAVDRAFNHYRFDFLSAFYGQGNSNRPDYRKPSYGATEMIEWIHHHLTRNSAGRVGRFLRGEIPTRGVVALRRRFDREFRRHWGPQ